MQRLFFDILVLIALFIAPIWIQLPILLLGLFLYNNFIEIVIAGIVIDTVYGIPLYWLPIPVLYSLSLTMLFFLKIPIARQLRFQK